MKKIIHKLRRQPEEVRRHILHILIFMVAVIMMSLWAFSLGKNLSNSDTQAKIKEDLKSDPALLQEIEKLRILFK